MRQLSITPNITVTIGRHTRIYYAFVTTAPIDLDAHATMTLYAATFADVAGFAADPITHDRDRTLWVGTIGSGLASLCDDCSAFRRYGAAPGLSLIHI